MSCDHYWIVQTWCIVKGYVKGCDIKSIVYIGSLNYAINCDGKTIDIVCTIQIFTQRKSHCATVTCECLCNSSTNLQHKIFDWHCVQHHRGICDCVVSCVLQQLIVQCHKQLLIFARINDHMVTVHKTGLYAISGVSYQLCIKVHKTICIHLIHTRSANIHPAFIFTNGHTGAKFTA